MVVPNQQVQPGETLVQLEDTELSADYEVAERALLVAKAELKTVQQSAFVDIAQKARLSEVEANVRLRQAEVDQARLRLAKTRILAPTRGIVVLGDPNEWKGKPVRVGERIMLLADQNSVELKIMLPVKDSIALQSDAHVRVYFDNDPLNARQGQVIQAGYEPQHTTDEQFAYRLVARLDEPTKAIPRIGLRGTAKVYGGKVRLFFYLFRRPITALRQQLGW
jgi:multidrug efflux pump subunit AcrA (membrane-fusion protein)